MDGDAADVELLAATARREIGMLRADPRAASVAGNRGAALRQHLQDLLGAVEHRLSSPPEATAPIGVRQTYAGILRQSIIVLQGAHAALPWLAATRAPNINLGTLYLLEECARELVGADVDLVVVPDSEFMYSTTSWPFGAVVASTPGFSPVETRRPIVLNYPLSDSDRLLLHPIFAHELGHPACAQHGLVSAVEMRLDANPAFVADFASAVASSVTAWPAWSDAQRAGAIRTILRRWIEELLCDHLAVEAAGPAFLWAFAGFGLPLSYGDAAPTHPPNTLRIHLALEHLRERGWLPFVQAVGPNVAAWLTAIGAEAGRPLPAPYDFVRDQLVRHGQMIRDEAKSRIGASALDRVVVEAQSAEAADLLTRVILPVGLSDPLTPRSILMGGWVRGIAVHGDSPGGLVRALDDRPLQELVGKGIEMSVVATTWHQL